MTEHRFAHLTRNENCLRALDHILAEARPTIGDDRPFARGFVAGWRERAIAEPGKVTITREHLADLERAAQHAAANTCTCPCRGECTT